MKHNIEKIINLLQHKEEKIPKQDDVRQSTHEHINSDHVELPSINKHGLQRI